MIKLSEKGVFLASNNEIIAEEHFTGEIKKEEAKKGTIAWSILSSHNTSGNMDKLKIKFDSLASHDITFVGIVQTAKASGMERFPLPYVLTNCHNSLCAVGGTINGDDHVFGLSAAQRYGGIFVPPHIAVIHQYMREMMAGGGKMILGSDSHTRYGASDRKTCAVCGAAGCGAGYHRCCVQKRLRQKQSDGVRRSRCCSALYRFP